MESVAKGSQDGQTYYLRWAVLLSLVFFFMWYGLSSAIDIADISRNWPKYRCNPAIMPFAGLYGHDVNENFTFCLTTMFEKNIGPIMGPFAGILSVMIQNMMTFLQSINSLRMMLATLLGGISKLIQELVDRFRLLFSQVNVASARIKLLFNRVFGVLFSVMYMAMSGVMVGQNFGDSFIFKFLDTFCFAPETPIEIEGRGVIPIQDVRLGDICSKTGSRVTSVYKFQADGQPMVYLNGIEVSTNHFVLYEDKWIPASEHPDAKYVGLWDGGAKRPLVCLDTNDHRIPLGIYIFSDWDETSSSDSATMELAEKRLNGGQMLHAPRNWLYQPAMSGTTLLVKKNGTSCKASDICLEDTLPTGKVIGLGKRHVYSYINLPSGHLVTPSTLLWKDTKWIRAGHLYKNAIINSIEPIEMNTFVIFKTACIQTLDGLVMRDMCEVHSPDMEEPTANALEKPQKILDPIPVSC
jgi:hypothetical protein